MKNHNISNLPKLATAIERKSDYENVDIPESLYTDKLLSFALIPIVEWDG
jgi:hypothetical protein